MGPILCLSHINIGSTRIVFNMRLKSEFSRFSKFYTLVEKDIIVLKKQLLKTSNADFLAIEFLKLQLKN